MVRGAPAQFRMERVHGAPSPSGQAAGSRQSVRHRWREVAWQRSRCATRAAAGARQVLQQPDARTWTDARTGRDPCRLQPHAVNLSATERVCRACRARRVPTRGTSAPARFGTRFTARFCAFEGCFPCDAGRPRGTIRSIRGPAWRRPGWILSISGTKGERNLGQAAACKFRVTGRCWTNNSWRSV